MIERMSGRGRVGPVVVGALAVAVIGAAVGLGSRGLGVTPLNHASRPNLILILSDDQRADMVDGMPSVRGLAAHGVTFSNTFVTTSYCCPSRASILTGQYARHTGVLDNTPPDGGAPAFRDASTLATWLHDAGYTTAMIGKYLNRYGRYEPHYVPPGWDEWDAIASEPTASRYYDYTLDRNGAIVSYGDDPSDYSTTVLTDLALRFLRTARAPFFLEFAPIAPHRPATPAPGDAGLEQGNVPSDPPGYDERDVTDKPWLGRYPPLTKNAATAIHHYAADAAASLAALDRGVGEIMQLVEARGGLSNTVIVYMSDNGYMLGEHRLQGKLWPYEPSIRVPLIFRLPWQSTPRVESRLALNIDIAPTFAQLAGVTPGLPEDGRSLVPLLHDRPPRPAWRNGFVVEWLGDETAKEIPPNFEGLRTTRYLYVEYENGWRELYDLQRDPAELRNLAGSPGDAATQAGLMRELHRMLGD